MNSYVTLARTKAVQITNMFLNHRDSVSNFSARNFYSTISRIPIGYNLYSIHEYTLICASDLHSIKGYIYTQCKYIICFSIGFVIYFFSLRQFEMFWRNSILFWRSLYTYIFYRYILTYCSKNVGFERLSSGNRKSEKSQATDNITTLYRTKKKNSKLFIF